MVPGFNDAVWTWTSRMVVTMKTTLRSSGHDSHFQPMRSASYQATASLNVVPRRMARAASFTH